MIAPAQYTFGKDRLTGDPELQAWLYAREGKTAEANRILKANPQLVGVFATVARYLVGDRERALAELDYLANDKWEIRTYRLRVDPVFDPMRNDPRFTAIVKKTGLLDN